MRLASRSGLVGLGLVAFVIGLAEAVQVLRNMIAQAQGKCDWVPCVWPWTLPTLAAFVLLAATGAALVAWTALRRRS